MWKTVYNSYGEVVKGGWQHFSGEIQGEHQPLIMVEMLETDLSSSGRFLLTTAAGGGDSDNFENVLTDGQVDVDYERGTRRTSEITILNPSASFTPSTKGYDSDGPWAGLIYVNRVVRLWRGVRSAHGDLYVPIGTFFIDAAQVVVEQNMSLVNLTLSDFWKKLTKSYFGYNKKYKKGTYKNAIIKDILDAAGVPRTGPYGAVLTKMSGREKAGKIIGKAYKFEKGESRGEILKNLAKDWNLDMYFDPLGVFRSEDRKSDRSKQLVWTFRSQEIDTKGQNGMLITVSRSFNDDNLYNHVILIGTGNEKKVLKESRKVRNRASKFHEDRIGDRVFFMENDKWSSQSDLREAMARIWAKRINFSEDITAEVICNPALEADDKIKIVEREFAKVADSYRLQRFSVPLVTSKMDINATNIIRDEDLWD